MSTLLQGLFGVLEIVEREGIRDGSAGIILYNAINVSSQYILMSLSITQMSEGE